MNLFLKGEIMSMAQLKYKRVLLKISGEALAGDKHFGFDFDVVSKVCDVIKKCTDMGVQMGVVIGGGNFWRGVKNGEGYIERTRADHMGMLATAMNCMAVADVLEQKGVDVRVQTALEIKEVAEPYIRSPRHPAFGKGPRSALWLRHRLSVLLDRHGSGAARGGDQCRRDPARQEHRRRLQRRPRQGRECRQVRRHLL